MPGGLETLEKTYLQGTEGRKKDLELHIPKLDKIKRNRAEQIF